MGGSGIGNSVQTCWRASLIVLGVLICGLQFFWC